MWYWQAVGVDTRFWLLAWKEMFLFYLFPANPLGILIANLLSPALVPEGKHIPLMVNENCFNQSAGLIWIQLIYLFEGSGAGKSGNLSCPSVVQLGIYAVPAVTACALATLGIHEKVPPTPPSASATNSNSQPFFTGLKMVSVTAQGLPCCSQGCSPARQGHAEWSAYTADSECHSPQTCHGRPPWRRSGSRPSSGGGNCSQQSCKRLICGLAAIQIAQTGRLGLIQEEHTAWVFWTDVVTGRIAHGKARKILSTEEFLPPFMVPTGTCPQAELTGQSHTFINDHGVTLSAFLTEESELLPLKSAVTARPFSSSTYLH